MFAFRKVILASLFILSATVRAEVVLKKLSLDDNGRVKLRAEVNGQSVDFVDNFGDKSTLVTVSEDMVTAEFKAYKQPLFKQPVFLVISITTEDDDHGSLFLLEQPDKFWMVMNGQPIRARKVNLMRDFEGVMDGFEKVSNFGVAQSLRKMVEYFEVHPDKQLNDLFDSIETEDPFIKQLPKPHIDMKASTAGVIRNTVPADAQQPSQDPASDVANVPDTEAATEPDNGQADGPPPLTRAEQRRLQREARRRAEQQRRAQQRRYEQDQDQANPFFDDEFGDQPQFDQSYDDQLGSY